MPGMSSPLPLGWSFKLRERLECCIVAMGNFAAAVMKFRQPSQLMQSQGRLYVGHVVFEARTHHVVVPRTFAPVTFPGIAAHTMQAPDACVLDQFGVSGEH